MSELDWLTCTFQEDVTKLPKILNAAGFCLGDVKPTKPKNPGYRSGMYFTDLKGDVILTCEYGSASGWNEVYSSGSQPCARVRDVVSQAFKSARATRVDSAIDLRGDFNKIVTRVREAAFANYGVRPLKAYSFIDEGQGRTCYFGSRKSSALVRVYEKGLEQRSKGLSNAPLDWVRVELQWRPSKLARVVAMTAHPDAFWGATKWTQGVALAVGISADRVSLPSELSSFESGYAWLVKCGHKTFAAACERYGLDAVVSDLRDGTPAALDWVD